MIEFGMKLVAMDRDTEHLDNRTVVYVNNIYVPPKAPIGVEEFWGSILCKANDPFALIHSQKYSSYGPFFLRKAEKYFLTISVITYVEALYHHHVIVVCLTLKELSSCTCCI